MKKPFLILTALLSFCLFVNTSFAQTAPAAGSGDVSVTMAGSDNTSVAAFLVKVANLNQSLAASGPFTVFAPTNDALTKLSSAKLDSLTADPTKLATLLKAHTVVGKFAKDDIVKALNASKDRKVAFKTIDGGDLTLTYTGGKLVLTDSKGNSANVLLYNLKATNGVVHGLSDVLIDK
jgi:uncharacterized surface protein with fasciclin (FAS1) repeats